MYSDGVNYEENPSKLPCFEMCMSCFRCEDKGRYAKCSHCSGRHDPQSKRDPYDKDDYCRCKEGILQYRTQVGQLIQRRYKVNPFEGQVVQKAQSQDERDWESYLQEKRDMLGDETWNPIKIVEE